MGDLFRRSAGEFADMLADWLAVPEVQVECSGTASLYIALEYLKGRSSARKVVVLAFTCPLVAMAVQKAGLELCLCDVAEHSLEFDLEKLAGVLGEDTLCVIATHWGGALTDAHAVRQLLAQHAPRAFLIEDCAQAFGGMVDGRTVGLVGDVSIFSFAVGKGLTLYEGGCLLAKDQTIKAGLRETGERLRQRDTRAEWLRSLELAAYHVAYRPWLLPFVYGFPRRYWMNKGNLIKAYGDDLEAIPVHQVGRWRKQVGANALTRLSSHLQASRANFAFLQEAIAAEGLGHVATSPSGALPAATYLILTLDTAAQAAELIRQPASYELGVTRQFAFPLVDYPVLSAAVGSADTPQARRLSSRTVTLSTSPYSSRFERTQLLGLIRSVVSGAHRQLPRTS